MPASGQQLPLAAHPSRCKLAALLTAHYCRSNHPTHPPTSPKQVTAFDGPSSQSDPMLVDSSTPGADGAPASSSSSSGPSATPGPESGTSADDGCREVPTPDGYSCQQQKDWGKCGQDFIQTNGYCKCTCGGGSNNGNGSQQQQQAGGSRRMLRQQR